MLCHNSCHKIRELPQAPEITQQKWRPRRDSNPCYSLERAVSWAWLDDGDVLTEARSILITVRVGNELLAFLARGAPRLKRAVLAGFCRVPAAGR